MRGKLAILEQTQRKAWCARPAIYILNWVYSNTYANSFSPLCILNWVYSHTYANSFSLLYILNWVYSHTYANSFSLLYCTWMPDSHKMPRLCVIFTTTLSTLILRARIKTALPVPLISSTHPIQENKGILCKEGKLCYHNPKSICPHKSYGTRYHWADSESPLLHEISLSNPQTQ